MERIGIYGGTFNPPHIGHLEAAKQAVKSLGLSKLLLIPAYAPPHKAVLPEHSPTAQQRLEMLRIAAAGCPELSVSDMELRREGGSYSCETVEAVKGQFPGAELVLLMGTDMFLTFDTWMHPEEIVKNASLGVFYRGDKGEQPAIAKKKAEMEARGVTVYLVRNEVIPISSTQMRRLLAFRCAGRFLPEGVLDYIRENRLYDTRADWKNLPMEALEPIVISLLNPNRVKHVLGCRDTAVALAKRWGANVNDAARAGILHDITKAIDGPLQLTLCDAYGKLLDDFSKRYPRTLHALTGSMVAQRIFGENENVVSAIEFHTTGRANMTLLEKIIYVADYMEPNRAFSGVEALRELAFTDIDAALKLGLEMTLEHLNEQGAEVSPASQNALAWLKR